MEERFLIIDIRDVNHSKYGNVTMVKANPLTDMEFGVLASTCEDDGTKTFLVPNEFADDVLVNIARAKHYWNPNLSDFTIEKIYDQDRKKHISIYVDNSLLKSSIRMVFPIREFYASSDFEQGIELNEKWIFERDCVKTPHGNLTFNSLAFVNDIEIGIQFLSNGIMKLNEISASLYETNIKMLRLTKFRNETKKSIALFDGNQNLIANFFGGDLSFDKYTFSMYKYYKA